MLLTWKMLGQSLSSRISTSLLTCLWLSIVNGDYLLQLSNLRGAFDNEHLVLPRTKYDVEIDRDSPRPGQQAFEKMIAVYYLGEVFRLVLLDLHAQGAIFEGKSLTKLHEPYSIDTSILAEIESDSFENLIETGDMFIQKFGLECTEPELRLIRRLAELIGLRAARLSACGVAAIAKKKKIQVRQYYEL